MEGWKLQKLNRARLLPIYSYPGESWKSIFTTFRFFSEYSWASILLAIESRICYLPPFFFFQVWGCSDACVYLDWTFMSRPSRALSLDRAVSSKLHRLFLIKYSRVELQFQKHLSTVSDMKYEWVSLWWHLMTVRLVMWQLLSLFPFLSPSCKEEIAA